MMSYERAPTSSTGILCERMLALADRSDGGRAAMLGLLHLSEEAKVVTFRLRVFPSGRVKLVVEAHPHRQSAV